MDNSSNNVISEERDDSETHMEHQISQHMEHSDKPKEEHSNQVPLSLLSKSGEQHSEHDMGYPSTSQKDLESNAQHMELSNQPSELVTQSRTNVINMESQGSLDNTQIPQKFAEEEINDSLIEQVRLTMPNKDHPTLQCLTFQTWILGITSGAAISFMNQFFSFQQNSVHILSVSAQIPVLLLESSWQHT